MANNERKTRENHKIRDTVKKKIKSRHIKPPIAALHYQTQEGRSARPKKSSSDVDIKIPPRSKR